MPLLAERFARQQLAGDWPRLDGHVADEDSCGAVPLRAQRGPIADGARLVQRISRPVAPIAWSGGSEPGARSTRRRSPRWREVGIDITGEFPKPWTDEILRAADVVVTMGCGDACPFYPGKRYEDWALEDPAGQGVEAVRPIRDEIRERVTELLKSLGVDVG